MDLKDIAAISGKSGLYRVVSKTKTGAIVESLEAEGKRLPVQQHQPLALLEEVTIYSKKADELSLKDIFEKMHETYGGELPVKPKDDPEKLRNFFSEVAPDHDEERVYPSDIKKVVQWYNILHKKELIK